jgi:hypothetical protein
MSNLTQKTPQIQLGTAFEYRVARLRFCQGNFVRRSIDVWPSSAEKQQLAEIDLISVFFDPQMHRTSEIIECKTGAGGTGEIDRLLWLKGIGDYGKTNSVTFAKLQIAPRTREFARQLNVEIMDMKTIETIERSLKIPSGWWPGFHNPEFGEKICKPARIELTSIQRIGKYLFGGFWFVDDFTRIKQLRSLFRVLIENSSDISKNALKLGIGEATTLFIFTTISIASWQNQLSDEGFRELIVQELSTGLGDPISLRNLLRKIDDLHRMEIESLHKVYQENGVGRIVFPIKSLEKEILTPPEWVDGYLELVSRFSKRPNLALNVLRWCDLWSASLLGANLENKDHELFFKQENELDNALNLVIAFLTRMWGVPSDLFERNNNDITNIYSNEKQNPELFDDGLNGPKNLNLFS